MATATTKPPRETLNPRISATERSLIDRAAASAGKTRRRGDAVGGQLKGLRGMFGKTGSRCQSE